MRVSSSTDKFTELRKTKFMKVKVVSYQGPKDALDALLVPNCIVRMGRLKLDAQNFLEISKNRHVVGDIFFVFDGTIFRKVY